MKKLRTLSMLLTMVAALSLIGCTKDRTTDADGGDVTPEDDGNYVFVSAAIALPTTGTRSSTEGSYGDGKGGNDQNNSDIDKKDPNGEDWGTDNGPEDSEYGYDYENDVRSMLIMFATDKDEYIVHTVVKGITKAPAGTPNFNFKVDGEIKYTDLLKAYETGPLKDLTAAATVYVYVYANYTVKLVEQFDALKEKISKDPTNADKTEWIDFKDTVDEKPSLPGSKPSISNSIWASRSFLMANAKTFTTTFPKEAADWGNFADKNSAFDLSTEYDDSWVKKTDAAEKAIRIERVAARLDFRDGSKGITEEDNTYELKVAVTEADQKDNSDGDLNLFNIHLTRMSLVNMSKEFYYLRRVSDDGLGKTTSTGNDQNTTITNKWQLLGLEYYTSSSYNYVVDTDYDLKSKTAADNEGHPSTAGIHPANAREHFNFPLYETEIDKENNLYQYARTEWYSDNINDVLKGATDTWGGSISDRYHIWRYVTENTLPGSTAVADDKQGAQQTIQSVGIIFKGAILAGRDIQATYEENGGEVKKGDEVKSRAGEGEGEGEGKTDDEPAIPVVRYVSQDVEIALKVAAKHVENDAKAEPVVVEEGESVEDAIENLEAFNYPILYSYDNLLYAGIEDLVRGAAAMGYNSELYYAVNDILKNWTAEYTPAKEDDPEVSDDEKEAVKFTYKAPAKDDDATAKVDETGTETVTLSVELYNDILNNDTDVKFKNCKFEFDFTMKDKDDKEAQFMALAPANGITIYKASYEDETAGGGEGWGYYCYYFYWNRHNDNLKSGEMGPMEFATVRNNVYKLSVTKIGQLGHPRLPEYDPDPVKPNDPDEEPTRYFQVKVEVLPWVVRVNNIEF